MELTANELISNPLRKVRAEVLAAFWDTRGINAAIDLVEEHDDNDPVSI